MERCEDRQKERGGLFTKGFGLPKSNKVEVEVVSRNGSGHEEDYGYGQHAEQARGTRENALQ